MNLPVEVAEPVLRLRQFLRQAPQSAAQICARKAFWGA